MASTIKVIGVIWPVVQAEIDDWVAVTFNGARVLGQISDFWGEVGVMVDLQYGGAGYYYDWGDIEPVTDSELLDLEDDE